MGSNPIHRSVKRNDWIYLSAILICYILLLFFTKRSIFSYRFDPNLVNRYFLSQDIPHEVPGKRLFLSDGDIHIAAGHLYAQGNNPTEYNFQHPPLIKYLYGFSIQLFHNPYIIQVFFGLIFLSVLYIFGKKLYKLSTVPILACLLLAVDPLFLNLSSQTLLDLGQSALLLLYTLVALFFAENFIIMGLILGLAAGSKFWAAPLFFVLAITTYKFVKKELKLKLFLLHLTVAFFVFSFLYGKTFIDHHGNFNIIFFQLKTLKYWLHHSVTSFPGASLILFITGYFQTWWGHRGFIKADTWTFLWPISFMIGTYSGIQSLVKKKLTIKSLVALIPVTYLIYLGVQAPFPRYFILILPFSYLVLSEFIVSKLNKIKK